MSVRDLEGIQKATNWSATLGRKYIFGSNVGETWYAGNGQGWRTGAPQQHPDSPAVCNTTTCSQSPPKCGPTEELDRSQEEGSCCPTFLCREWGGAGDSLGALGVPITPQAFSPLFPSRPQAVHLQWHRLWGKGSALGGRVAVVGTPGPSRPPLLISTCPALCAPPSRHQLNGGALSTSELGGDTGGHGRGASARAWWGRGLRPPGRREGSWCCPTQSPQCHPLSPTFPSTAGRCNLPRSHSLPHVHLPVCGHPGPDRAVCGGCLQHHLSPGEPAHLARPRALACHLGAALSHCDPGPQGGCCGSACAGVSFSSKGRP